MKSSYASSNDYAIFMQMLANGGKVSIVYMHNMRPNEELYHHLRVRTVAYGCLD